MVHIDIDILSKEKGLKFVHINETWLNVSVPDAAIIIPGFTLVRQDRYIAENKKGGGICMYINDNCIVEHLLNCGTSTGDYEVLGIKAKFSNIKPCYVFGIYRPPKGKTCNVFEKISNLFDQIDLSRNELIVLGDMNIDYSSNVTLKKLHVKDFESRYNISQLIDTVTRSTTTTATLLDWIYINTDHVANYGTLNHNLSDHFPTFFIRKKKRNKIVKKEVKGRSYLRYNAETFNDILGNKDWNNFDNALNDPNQLWEIFHKNIIETLDNLCPIKVLTVPDKKPVWLNNEILLLMRKRIHFINKRGLKTIPLFGRKHTLCEIELKC